MLKTLAKVAFKIYHLLFASPVPTCRYQPTCSKYALEAVEKHGAYGLLLALRRVLSCHPLSKRPFYDPVQ